MIAISYSNSVNCWKPKGMVPMVISSQARGVIFLKVQRLERIDSDINMSLSLSTSAELQSNRLDEDIVRPCGKLQEGGIKSLPPVEKQSNNVSLIANEVVSVQPMTAPVFSMKLPRYGVIHE